MTKADVIELKHGAGGGAMRRLIADVFLPLATPVDGIGLDALDDGAALRIGNEWLVITTDSHVVQPAFFPGGDIGRLAVCGTVNDLAMMGATQPLAITCAVIVEEGFSRAQLLAIRDSIKTASEEAGAPIVTGDTKVMGKGEIDGIVLNTSGVGLTSQVTSDAGLRPGDAIILTGTVGDHGLAVLSHRHHLGLEGELKSDVAPINDLIRLALTIGGRRIVAMKDPTRGGLVSALQEMATKAHVGIVIEETRVSISAPVRAAAELLGIDPLCVANEGKAVLGVEANIASDIVAGLRKHPKGRDAAIIGTVVDQHQGTVVLVTDFGRRLLVELDGEPLPRIC